MAAKAETPTRVDAEAEAPAIKALGPLFKLTEVFLSGSTVVGVQPISSSVAQDGSLSDETHLLRHCAVVGKKFGSFGNGVTLSLEELELTEQMSALGLPISFSTNREKRNVVTKGRRKVSHKKLVECLTDNKTTINETNVELVDADVTSGYWMQKEVEFNEQPHEDIEVTCCKISESFISSSFEGLQSLDCGESHEDGLDRYSSCGDFSEWHIFWDEFYHKNYFYNSKTQMSTWHPPPGLMQYDAITEEANLCREVAYGDLYVDPLLGFQAQGNVESLENVAYQLESEDVWRSDPQLILVNSKADVLGISENLDSSIAEEENNLDGGLQDKLSNDWAESGRTRQMSEALDNYLGSGAIKRKNKKSRNRMQKNVRDLKKGSSPEVSVDGFSPNTVKYWCQRYLLFSRFDEGVQMDEEGWFSVTPEPIAVHHASRCSGGTIIDCFTGVGGNAIQFAMRCNHVIAIDIDQRKIEYAKHNATIYGVEDSIDFVNGDFFCLAPKLKGDVVYLSPPWGGPDYSKVDTYDLRTMLKPQNGYVLFEVAMEIASRVVMFLPRNVDLNQLAEIALLVNPPCALEVESNFLNGKLKAITAYFTKAPVGNEEAFVQIS